MMYRSPSQVSVFDNRVSDEYTGSHITRHFVERKNSIYNSKSPTCKPFNSFKSLGYVADPFERKESMKRDERYRHFEKIHEPFRNAGS